MDGRTNCRTKKHPCRRDARQSSRNDAVAKYVVEGNDKKGELVGVEKGPKGQNRFRPDYGADRIEMQRRVLEGNRDKEQGEQGEFKEN